MAKKKLQPKTHIQKRYSTPGIIVATVFYTLSYLPSLLPRPWLYQALIAGISASIGYAVGCSLAWLYRWTKLDEPSTKTKADTKRVLSVLVPTFILLAVLLGASWQREVSKLVSQEPISNYYMVPIVALSLLTVIGIIGLARLTKKIWRYLSTKGSKFLPERVSAVLSLALIIMFGFWVMHSVFVGSLLSIADSLYAQKNDTTPQDVSQPSLSTRSGSSESLIEWDTIGAQGQRFVSRGPNIENIRALHSDSQDKSSEPIRIYAGLRSANTAKERAELVVAEMKRTGAFDKEVVVVATPTGTGWLEPQSVDSLEYMFNGDTAIVAQQYSYLPSWISFLVDSERAREAGRALFDSVHSEWLKIPEDSRPKLITYGLSLGSFGSQAAFSGPNDMQSSISGALYLGTPNNTELWNEITSNRDNGSPQWKPVFEKSRNIRFASNNEDIINNQDEWQGSRVLYVQHASDPVVWFSFDLLLSKPDWLREERGDDVSSKTRWYPFITFFQVGVDQFFGTSVPNGHGHNYPNTIVSSWEAVAQPSNWSEDKSTKLQKIIDTYGTE